MSDPILLYKALSEETRLKSLLLMQSQGELCVCDLMDALSLSQPKVSGILLNYASTTSFLMNAEVSGFITELTPVWHSG